MELKSLTRMCRCLCSKHPAAELHAAARVLSGGSIYVSDTPGQHDFDLLRRLVLPDGSILRALSAGRPTRDSLFTDVARDGNSLLKVTSSSTLPRTLQGSSGTGHVLPHCCSFGALA